MPDTAERRQGWRFDRHISAGHIITTAVVLVGAVAGFIRVENLATANQQDIRQLQAVVSENRQFQVGQRSRVWDRVEELQVQIADLKSDVAALRTSNDHIARQVDRLVTHMVESPKR